MLDIIPIDEWAQANEVTDPVQKYKKYNTYVKSQVLQSDDVSEEERDNIFGRINQRTLEGLKAEGKTDEEIQNAFAPEPFSFDRKLEIVHRSLAAVDDDEAASTIRDYYASLKFAAAPDTAQEFVQKVEAQKPLVEQYVADFYDEAVQSQILNNDIPFARVELPDGQVALVAGPSAVGLKPYDAYRKSLAAGTIREEDLDGVIDSMRKDSNGYELFRHKNFEEAQDYVNSAQKTDPNLQYQIAQAAQEIADTGKLSDATYLQFRVFMLNHNPNLARQYDAEDLRAVLEYTAGSQAMVAGIAEYDDENAANNVRKFGYGYTTLHRDTILNNEKYAEATKGLPEGEKRELDGQRALLREAQFDQFNKSLSRSYLGEEWQSFLQAGLAEGKDRADILDEFTNSDAYSGAANIAQHIGLSIGEAITDIGWGIGTVAGSDTARQNLIENYRDRQARADVAELFGQGFGMGVELSSMVAPVIADMAATAGLSVLTGVAGGVGGAVAFGGAAAKRGIVKTLKNSILKEAVDQAEGAAIRTAMTTGSRATVSPAMKSFAEHYAKVVGSKATTASSLFIPAAARSGSMTYAAVYDALERSPEGQNLTPEERHDKALAAGATAGMVTGIITTASSFGGRGGLEDFVLRRATGKDIRKVMDGLAGRTLSNEAYNGVLKALLADGAKQFARRAAGKEIIKGFKDEALEEGFDEYLNTIIQAVATNEDLAFIDVAHSTMMGALYGGVFGAAVGPARKGFQTLMDVVTPADPTAATQREAEVKRSIALVSANRLIRDKANSLKQADLPQTAREFERQMQEAITARADDVKQASTAKQPAATELEDILSPDELATIDEEAAAAAEQPAAVEPAAVEPNSLEEAVQKRKAKEAATLEPNISADQSGSLDQQLADSLRQDIDDQFTPEDDVVTPEEDTAELIKKVLASSTADIEDNVDKVTKAKPEASKVKEIPVDSPEVLKAKAEERIAELIEIGIPFTLMSGKHGLPKLGEGSKEYLKQKTAEMAKAISDLKNNKKSIHYVPKGKEFFKWNNIKEDEATKYKSQPAGAVGLVASTPEGGILFNNDPVVINHALTKLKRPFIVIPNSYNGPIAPSLEVVSEGRVRKVVGVKKAIIDSRETTKGGVANNARKAELANAIYPIQEAEFYQAGLFRGDESEKKFILDGPMLVGDALKSFDKWVTVNQDRIIAGKGQVGGTFSALSDLSKVKSVKDREALRAEILYDFIFDVRSKISIAALRKLVEPHMENGVIAENKLDDLIEEMALDADDVKRGSFYMSSGVEGTLDSLKENGGLSIGRTTYEGADLIEQAKTRPQKLAAFFYHLLSGRSSITGESKIFQQEQMIEEGIITDPKKSRNRSSLKKGWEKKMIKKALEEIYQHPHFSKQEGRPFPDFPRDIVSAANRVRQRFLDDQKRDRMESNIEEMGERQQEQVGLADEELQAGAADEGGVDFAQDEDLSFDEVDQSDDPMKKASNYAFILHNFRNKTAFYLSGLSDADRQSAEKAIYDFAGAVFGTTADEIKSSGQYDLSGTNSVVSELLHRIQSRPVKPELQAYFNSVYETLPPPLRSAAAIMGLDVPVRLSFEKAEALFHQRVAVREQFTQRTPNESADVEANRAKNNEDILRLGLVDGDAATVTVALQKISRSGVDESHKAVAKLLLREVSRFNNVQFRIVDNANTNYAGLFTAEPDGTRRVTLNIASTYGKGIESVLLHEYLHAATHDLLRSDNLTSKQQTALRRLEALRSEVAAEYGTSGSSQITMDNGLSNIDEFISSLFTSPAFQENVRALPKRGFVQRILDAIRDLFGVPKKSVLARAFDDLVDFLNMEVSPAPAGFDAVEQRVRRNRASANTREKLIVDSYLNENVGQLRANQESPDIRFTSIENIESDDELTDTQREAIDQLIDETIKQVVPADVPVYEVTDPEASTFKSRPNALFVSRVVNVNGRNVASIIINRPAAQAALTEMHGEVVDSIHVKQLLEAILNEEVFHAAELRSISRAEIDELANELSQYDLEEAIDAYTQDAVFANELKAAVQEGDTDVTRQVVGELLRMKAQRLTRGYTTEEDRAFYYSSPKFHRVMFRYVVGLFKRMAAAYNLRKDNAEMARMVNRLAREASVLRSGVLRIQQRLQFDALAPNMAENELSALFSATLEKGKPIEITADMTIEDIIKRMPMFAEVEISIGSFDLSGYKENSWIAKTLNGELDPRVLELFKQSDAVKRSIPARAASLYQEIAKAIQSSPELDYELIGDYLGRQDDTEVPTEFYNYRKDVFQTAYQNRGGLTPSEREQLYIEMVDEPVAIEKSRLVSVAKKKKKIAEQKLLNNHRDLYDKMAELRMILDGLSVVLRDKFDTSGELRMAIDRNLGIYVTRAYRAFNEEGYMDKLIHFIEQDKGTITDKVMLQRYNQVYALFEDSYINNYAYGIVKDKDEKNQPTSSRMSLEEARAFGKATLEERQRNGSDPIQEAILEYLYSLDPNSRFTSGKIASSVAKSVVDQIRKRENVPEPIRELLGQYDDADVVDNILRSITALTRAVSRESFIHNLITLGTKSGFVVPLKEAQRRLNLGDTSVRGFVNLRNGARIASSDIENETLADSVENDFTKSLYFYIDPAAYAALKKHMSFQSPADLSSDKKMIEDILTGYRRFIGGSLAAKTLGSFGFYLRNVMGNLVFFAPMQGVNPVKMTKHIGRVVTALKTPKAVDDYTAELMSYNVVQGDVRTQFAKELMSGKVTLDSLRGEIAETDSKIKKLKKASKKADKKIKLLTDRLFALSDAVDTFFKIGVYEHELDVLRKAQQHEIKAGISDGEFFGLKEHDLKKMASITTRNTTQSYVDAYEFVKYSTSKYSYLLPPFLRFRMDILRLLFDGTPKQIKKEISSNNPIIKSRGYKRLGGFILVVGGFSIVKPLALRAIFGFGDEEDELIREGQLPDYQRNSTLFYFGDFVADFTFLNPISGGGPDLVLRAFEDTMRGNPSEGIMRAIKMIASEYAGEQILLQAANDVRQNKDSRTGDPIYEEDEGVSALFKMFGYLFKEAYSPRTPEAVLKAAITAAGDESQDPLRSSAGIIIRELMPIRPTAVDIPRAYQQALAKQRDKRNRLSSKMNRLRSRGSLTEGEIEELARDFVEDRKRIDRDIARYTKAALSKGMTVAEVQNSMKYYRMSGDRIKDILYRRFKRPEISEALIRDLQSMGPVGAERLQRVQQVIGQYSRYETL